MSGTESSWRRSIAPTLGWFVVIGVATLLLLDGNINSILDRVRKSDTSRRAQPPGPGFVGQAQREQAAKAPPLPPKRVVLPRHRRPKYKGQRIDDPCVKKQADGTCAGHALDGFYAALLSLERKQPHSIVRIAHLGDSVVAAGQITTRARHRFQNEFGDGGAGFLFMRQPNRYYHAHAAEQSFKNWQIRSIGGKSTRDGLYGYGASSFTGYQGARTTFSTMTKGKFGTNVSRFELYYFKQPKGGTAEVELDGKSVATIDSSADKRGEAFRELKTSDGAHELTLKVHKGPFRAFGLVMERDSGVVYENLGVVGAWAHAFTKIDKAHWTAQYRHRAVNLVIFFMGSNEADFLHPGKRSMAHHQKTYEDVIAPIMAANPNSACLVMAPLDNAVMKDGTLTSLRVIPYMVKAQHKAARAQGCAFWNTFHWMGGYGSARSWRRRRLFWADYEHPTPRGGAKIADALFDAMMAGYDDYKDRLTR